MHAVYAVAKPQIKNETINIALYECVKSASSHDNTAYYKNSGSVTQRVPNNDTQ